jgi:hypothetical protein
MHEDTILRFMAAAPEERMRMALDQTAAATLRGYLGEEAFAEYAALAERVIRKTGGRPLSLEAPTNLLFVPGVMGSLLFSETMGGVWWIDVRTRRHIDDLRLSADGQRDANPDHRVAPFTVDTTYEAFLAAVIAREDFGHALFPYDWRRPLTSSAPALRDKVAELYKTNGGVKVNLVTHSMGGLVVRAALAAHGDELWPMLGRIVFIGTPHYGSPAVAGYLKNHLWGFDMMAVLGRYLSPNTFRSLWGVISLLPAPRGIYPGTRDGSKASGASDGNDEYAHPCANFDMYDAGAWGLEEDTGVNPLGLDSQERERLQKVLDGAKEFHRTLYEAHTRLDQSLRDRMAVIAGVGYKTLFRLAFHDRLFAWRSTEKVMSRVPGDPNREGDGRAPLASAALENVGETRYVKGVHGGLPMIPDVYEDVFRWLKGERLQLPVTPQGALGESLSSGAESETPHLDGTAKCDPREGDPGFWEIDPPVEGELLRMESELDTKLQPDFIRVKIL